MGHIFNSFLPLWLLVISINSVSLLQKKLTPLYLTPLIESGQIHQAQTAAKVWHPEFQQVESYSGLLTVDKVFDSNLFFWFFPAAHNYTNAPIILWLQGGPGASSLLGLFNEHGPFMMREINKLEKRPVSWTQNYSVIYMDQPAGTGYSYTKKRTGYAKNQDDVATNLYEALIQFFRLFPIVQNNEFYVFGESYAGKYVPSICHKIHRENPKASLKINLAGLAIGNGYSDPINQLDYSAYVYQASLVDGHVRDEMKKNEDLSRKNIIEENWDLATKYWETVLDLYSAASGNFSTYNYITNISEIRNYPHYIQRRDIRKAIHVGLLPFNDQNSLVYQYLQPDIMKSVAHFVSDLLSHYRVLIYNGQLDVIVAYPLTDNYLNKLSFSAAKEFATAQRKIWQVGNEVAGYCKQAGNLTQILVRNAGHIVPGDQPVWAYDMVERFISNRPFN